MDAIGVWGIILTVSGFSLTTVITSLLKLLAKATWECQINFLSAHGALGLCVKVTAMQVLELFL